MHYVRKLSGDIRGLARICGFVVTCRWIAGLIVNLRGILVRRDLQAADRWMGSGPYSVRIKKYGVCFKIKGTQAISGIREMYVRDTYLHDHTLAIRDGDCVIDLGANMGNFTNLALAHGSSIKVIAVEPSKQMNAAFEESVGLNDGFRNRVTLVNAFVGSVLDSEEAPTHGTDYADAKWLSEEELIATAGIRDVDFLKCDIEGGEFGLLTSESKLLQMSRSLAIEIHQFAGDVAKFLSMLQDCGFTLLRVDYAPDGSATALARREPAT